MSVEGPLNKLRAIFYGPGWCPGTPRLGDIEQLPKVIHSRLDNATGKCEDWIIFMIGLLFVVAQTMEREKFARYLAPSMQIYAILHFAILSRAYSALVINYKVRSFIESIWPSNHSNWFLSAVAGRRSIVRVFSLRSNVFDQLGIAVRWARVGPAVGSDAVFALRRFHRHTPVCHWFNDGASRLVCTSHVLFIFGMAIQERLRDCVQKGRRDEEEGLAALSIESTLTNRLNSLVCYLFVF